MGNDIDDDIDLGEDFDFDDDIPEEDVDIDGAPEISSDNTSKPSSNTGNNNAMARQVTKIVAGIASVAIVAGVGYFSYSFILSDPKEALGPDAEVFFAQGKKEAEAVKQAASSIGQEFSGNNSNQSSTGSANNSDSSGINNFNKLSFDDIDGSSSSGSSNFMQNNAGDIKEEDVPVNANQQSTQQISKQHDELKDTLNTLAIELSTNINHVQNLERVVRDMSKIVRSLDRTVKQIDDRVVSLSNNVSQVTGAIGSMKSELDVVQGGLNKVQKFVKEEDLDLADSVADSNKIVYEAPEYVVHAVIPGRAWLKSTHGKIITVTEGYSLGKYGTIAVIDADNGTVVTSSGVTFR